MGSGAKSPAGSGGRAAGLLLMTTAAGRVWRRAPLWRLVLTAALAFGVLSALYPAPSLHLPLWLHLPKGKQAAAVPPAPPPPPQAKGSVEARVMPVEPTMHGVITVAGRTVPLPAGDWHELAAAREEDVAEISDIVLGRWQGGALTGLLEVRASTGPAEGGQRAGVIKDCDSYDNFTSKWSDGGQTCWLIRKINIPAPGTDPAAAHTMIGASLARLQMLGVTAPPWLAAAVWSHASGSEMMNYALMVANGRDMHDQSAALASLQGWMTRFAPLLRRGFDGRLDPAAVRTLGRDPGSTAGAGNPRG